MLWSRASPPCPRQDQSMTLHGPISTVIFFHCTRSISFFSNTEVSNIPASCYSFCPYRPAMRVPIFTCKLHNSVNPSSIASLFPSSVLTRQSPRPFRLEILRVTSTQHNNSTRKLSTIPAFKMSQKTFSNTEVPAGKQADPYTATNKTEPELKEKVQDLVSFIESCKFGMMTTRIESTGLLTSRCMALAAKVWTMDPRLIQLITPHSRGET